MKINNQTEHDPYDYMYIVGNNYCCFTNDYNYVKYNAKDGSYWIFCINKNNEVYYDFSFDIKEERDDKFNCLKDRLTELQKTDKVFQRIQNG